MKIKAAKPTGLRLSLKPIGNPVKTGLRASLRKVTRVRTK